jgi:dienelactone hydrolase
MKILPTKSRRSQLCPILLSLLLILATEMIACARPSLRIGAPRFRQPSAIATVSGSDVLAVGVQPDCHNVPYLSRGLVEPAEFCRPREAGDSVPAVIVLHGCGGPGGPPGMPLGTSLARRGFATLELYYFAQTPRPRGSPDFCFVHGVTDGDLERAWPVWKQNVIDGATFLESQRGIEAGGIGLVGWSLGAELSFEAAADDSHYAAIVDLSGSVPRNLVSKPGQQPPVLILHGDDDSTVPVAEAYRTRDTLSRAGRESELFIYHGVGHTWNGPEAAKALQQMTDFLKQHLHADVNRQ